VKISVINDGLFIVIGVDVGYFVYLLLVVLSSTNGFIMLCYWDWAITFFHFLFNIFVCFSIRLHVMVLGYLRILRYLMQFYLHH
jgi:hypothetical protein